MRLSLEEPPAAPPELGSVNRQHSGGVTTVTLTLTRIAPGQFNVLSSTLLTALQQALDNGADDAHTAERCGLVNRCVVGARTSLRKNAAPYTTRHEPSRCLCRRIEHRGT